jgi:hypothetical protein
MSKFEGRVSNGCRELARRAALEVAADDRVRRCGIREGSAVSSQSAAVSPDLIRGLDLQSALQTLGCACMEAIRRHYRLEATGNRGFVSLSDGLSPCEATPRGRKSERASPGRAAIHTGSFRTEQTPTPPHSHTNRRNSVQERRHVWRSAHVSGNRGFPSSLQPFIPAEGRSLHPGRRPTPSPRPPQRTTHNKQLTTNHQQPTTLNFPK